MAKNPKRPINWISKFFAKTEFILFLKDNGIDLLYATTQHNCILDQEIIKIHGDPTRNHHDWVIAMHMNHRFLCHVLCFACIGQVDDPINSPFGVVNEPGEYVYIGAKHIYIVLPYIPIVLVLILYMNRAIRPI